MGEEVSDPWIVNLVAFAGYWLAFVCWVLILRLMDRVDKLEAQIKDAEKR